MIEFLSDYGLFVAKAVTIVLAVLVVVGGVLALSRRTRSTNKLEVKSLNQKYDTMEQTLKNQMLTKKELKALAKQKKEKQKAEKKAKKTDAADDVERRLFVVDFEGDIKASNVTSLREEITAILTVAGENDRVIVNLENTGGVVHEHGLAASQLQRVRDAGIPLTVAVDKVAASGGYMMACVADHIIAAPFAVIGSIGVLAQLPNFNDLLSKHGVHFEQETAGEYKRTLTMFGKNTDKERKKLRAQIEDTHTLFKNFVAEHRPRLDMTQVATGEYWYGSQALELGLVDELTTSDDYLLQASRDTKLYQVTYEGRRTVVERLMSSIHTALGARTAEHLRDARFPPNQMT